MFLREGLKNQQKCGFQIVWNVWICKENFFNFFLHKNGPKAKIKKKLSKLYSQQFFLYRPSSCEGLRKNGRIFLPSSHQLLCRTMRVSMRLIVFMVITWITINLYLMSAVQDGRECKIFSKSFTPLQPLQHRWSPFFLFISLSLSLLLFCILTYF